MAVAHSYCYELLQECNNITTGDSTSESISSFFFYHSWCGNEANKWLSKPRDPNTAVVHIQRLMQAHAYMCIDHSDYGAFTYIYFVLGVCSWW